MYLSASSAATTSARSAICTPWWLAYRSFRPRRICTVSGTLGSPTSTCAAQSRVGRGGAGGRGKIRHVCYSSEEGPPAGQPCRKHRQKGSRAGAASSAAPVKQLAMHLQGRSSGNCMTEAVLTHPKGGLAGRQAAPPAVSGAQRRHPSPRAPGTHSAWWRPAQGQQNRRSSGGGGERLGRWLPSQPAGRLQKPRQRMALQMSAGGRLRGWLGGWASGPAEGCLEPGQFTRGPGQETKHIKCHGCEQLTMRRSSPRASMGFNRLAASMLPCTRRRRQASRGRG